MSSILIIEDDEDILELILDELKNSGIRNNILSATNPVTGLELYNSNRDDISAVITDNYMPIENGLQLCKIIRSDNASIKLILLTSDKSISSDQDVTSVNIVVYKPDGIKLLPKYIKNLIVTN